MRVQIVGAVAGKVQHDFGNILSVIRLALKDGGRDKELLEAARESADKMKKLLDEMARISNLVQVNVSEIELVLAVESALHGVESYFEELKLELPESAGSIRVRADRSALSKVLLSVVSVPLGVDQVRRPLKVSVSLDGAWGLVEICFGAPLLGEVKDYDRSLIAFGPTLRMKAVELELWRALFVIEAMGGRLEFFPDTVKIWLQCQR